MPSCAEFGVINQYLSIKDQIDSGFYPDQPEVPDILDKQKQYEDTFLWPAVPEDEGLKPTNFLDVERGPWYLEPVDRTTLFDLSDVPMATTTTTTSSTATANNNNNNITNTAASMHNSPVAATVTQPPVSHSMTYVAVGAGCTVIQRGTPTDSCESDNSSSGSVHEGSPDIFDLDKQSFYGDETTSSSDFSAAKVKEEPLSYPAHDYPPSGYSSVSPLSSHRPSQQGYVVGSSAGFGRYERSPSSMESMMINSIKAEIRCTSESLGIPKSPYLWDASQTMKWVRHICLTGTFPDNCVPLFNVEGKDLCKMTVDDFKWRAGGELATYLHQNLDIIKMSLQIEPNTPVEEQLAFFSPAVAENPPVPSPDQYSAWPHTTSPSPSTGSQSSSSDEDSYASSSYSASQAASHNAAHGVSASQRGARPGKQTIHLWQFLRELLDDPDNYQSCIKWLDRSRGVFKIEDSSKVAKYWGRRKNRPAMNYDKLSRSVRQYYKKGIIKKTEMSKRLVYQFCTPYL